MRKMKAFVRTSATTQDVELQVAMPEIQSDHEVLIKMEAFGVGIHDRYFIPSKARFPYIILLPNLIRNYSLSRNGYR